MLLRLLSIFTIFSTSIYARNSSDSNDENNVLSLLLMGDPQFYFMCELDNVQCKHISKLCRSQFGLPIGIISFVNEAEIDDTTRRGIETCIRIESRFANRVQRQSIDTFLSQLEHKPAALIINGDLTDYGHLNQLDEFKKTWFNNFPIPLLLGLGNHDYQNNVDDCALNFCAHTMLSWYADYVKNRSLGTDIQRKAQSAFDVTYTGSLAYTERVCSKSGKECAFVIQLNNAVDYSVKFSSLFVEWELNSPLAYLQKELTILENTNLPILLNMHKCEILHMHKIKTMLLPWLQKGEAKYELNQKIPRIGVFYAHMHQKHEIHVHCIRGFKVPFLYVGSVPNNRFSWLKINSTTATVSGFKATDRLMHNGEVLEELGEIEIWGRCTVAQHMFFADSATKKNRLHIHQQLKFPGKYVV